MGCVGGVWKTEDGGAYWENISDGYFKTSAVGALAVSDSDPNVIYVGMGESCVAVPRLQWTAQADGVYRSTDGGRSWAQRRPCGYSAHLPDPHPSRRPQPGVRGRARPPGGA